MGRRILLALAALALAAAAPAAFAETITLTADLNSANEVPPHDGTASGSAEMTLDTATLTFTWNIAYSGLSGPAIGAHVHGPVHAGSNAGIMIPFPTAENPITGSMRITEAQARDILAGLTYVNIHTKEHPGGEIRGQIAR